MDVYKGHGEGDTKWKGCAWKLLLFKFNIVFYIYSKYIIFNFHSTIKQISGPDNSNLISTEKAVPTNPENNAYIKYKTPISLALEDKNHLSNHILIPNVFNPII
jgi:hypothetical protein